VGIAAALLAGVVGALLWLGDGGQDPVERGSVAPDFALPKLDAEATVRLSDLRGRVVLVNFWASWCKPCEDEMPAMERLYETQHPQGFELLAVSVGEAPDEVRAFRDRLGLSFPILLDADKTVSHGWQTFRFPESYLIGRDGVVVERYVGPRQWDHEDYVERIGRLLQDGDIR